MIGKWVILAAHLYKEAINYIHLTRAYLLNKYGCSQTGMTNVKTKLAENYLTNVNQFLSGSFNI